MSQEDGLWVAGEAYEPYVGRWSRLVAPEFVRWLAPAQGRDWVDVGCGTGELSGAILGTAAPRSIRGVDPSDGFVAFAKDRLRDDRATFTTGHAQDLPFEDGSSDLVVSGLVLNFVADPAAAVADGVRVTRTGGTVAAYVWDYAGEMQMMMPQESWIRRRKTSMKADAARSAGPMRSENYSPAGAFSGWKPVQSMFERCSPISTTTGRRSSVGRRRRRVTRCR